SRFFFRPPPGFGRGARCLYNMLMNFFFKPPRFLSGCKCRDFFGTGKPFRKKKYAFFFPRPPHSILPPCNELPETSRMLRLRAANLPPFSDIASFFKRFF